MKNILISFILLISLFSCKREIVEPIACINEVENNKLIYYPKRVITNNTRETKFYYNEIGQLIGCNTRDSLLTYDYLNNGNLIKKKCVLDSLEYEYTNSYIAKKTSITYIKDNYSWLHNERFYLSSKGTLSNSNINGSNYSSYFYKENSDDLSYILNSESNDSIVAIVRENCKSDRTSSNISFCPISISLLKYKNNKLEATDSISINDNLIKIYTNNFKDIITIEYFESVYFAINNSVLDYLQHSFIGESENYFEKLQKYDQYEPLFKKYNTLNSSKIIKSITNSCSNCKSLDTKMYKFEYQINQSKQLTQMSVSNNWDSKVDIYNFEY